MLQKITSLSFSFFGILLEDSHFFFFSNLCYVSCDLLWFHMNKVAHKGKIPDIQVLAASIKKIAMDHCNAWKSSYLISVDRWFPSFPSSYKINFDMTIRDSFSAQAVVCCDSNGKILQAISHISPTCDSNFGEALVARLVVSLAVLLNFLDFSLERDSHVVIMSFQHPFIVQD